MKTIKTRETGKDIKILDKSANLSSRMKDTFVRTKERAEETQQSRHSSPTDYASEKVQDTVQGAVRETVQHIPNPRQKASENWNRAKEHFQEAKRQMPQERQRTADVAQKTADNARTNADDLQKTADYAKETARDAKEAVRDAKQNLREVRETGRQTIRDAKQDAARDVKSPRQPTAPQQPEQQFQNPAQKRFAVKRHEQTLERSRAAERIEAPPHKTATDMNPLQAGQQVVSEVKPDAVQGLTPEIPHQSLQSTIPRQPVTESKNPLIRRFQEARYRKIKEANRAPGQADTPKVKTKADIEPPQLSRQSIGDVNPKGVQITERRSLTPRQRIGEKPNAVKGQPSSTAYSKPPGQVKGASPAQKPPSVTGNTAKGEALRPTYMNRGIQAAKKANNAAKTVDNTTKTVKSATKGMKSTAKGTVKTAQKSIKTAEKSAKAAVKTAQQTAKAAQKSAQAAAKAAKAAAQAAKAATKAAVAAAKAAVKVTVSMVKAIIAAIKGLVAAIAAGGWVAVLIIVIICLVALLVGSIFGIFFSGEPDPGTGMTMTGVIDEIDAEYTGKIDNIIYSNYHDSLDMSGARAAWKLVLAVYTVKTVSDPDNPMEVATMNDEKAAILHSIFWEMNTISYWIETIEHTETYESTGEDGNTTTDSYTWYEYILHITVSHKTPEEMAAQYGFTGEQKKWLAELQKPEYNSLWNALLYGITSAGDGSMSGVAETQLGNVGGEPYWSWYGFTERVEWCACFVSWCADQCGHIDAGIIPRFSGCVFGVQWFQDREQWQDNAYTPRPGDIIFFDWEGDGVCDHVGIVENVTDGRVNTIEGNSGDSCRRRSYDIDTSMIYGYGVPAY